EHHHALADLPAGQGGQVVTVELDPARQRVQQAGQGGQQGRFPGPRCTGDGQPGAGAEVQVQVADPRGGGGPTGREAGGGRLGAGVLGGGGRQRGGGLEGGQRQQQQDPDLACGGAVIQPGRPGGEQGSGHRQDHRQRHGRRGDRRGHGGAVDRRIVL